MRPRCVRQDQGENNQGFVTQCEAILLASYDKRKSELGKMKRLAVGPRTILEDPALKELAHPQVWEIAEAAHALRRMS